MFGAKRDKIWLEDVYSRMCTPLPISAGGEGDLTGPQLLEGGCWERGGDSFFWRGGGLQFSHKNKLKSEIFNDQINF